MSENNLPELPASYMRCPKCKCPVKKRAVGGHRCEDVQARLDNSTKARGRIEHEKRVREAERMAR